ncbi:MAG: ABC transporter ATP-binding protein [Candidatus Accumulibacter sp.]|uniref:ABC transporter ATP-binding protein n=1 Tax=Accumulibacter sp. TaxID=2053492 RepID=UPI0025D1C211|nr:ABC transporter ATP-binding protein [Accumulibacter sp.]MCP5249204.1 ABC transporter ATP-binding protein [Accumulibacter sp.]
MSSDRHVIVADGLVKRFALGWNPLRQLLGHGRQFTTALDGISFSVERGEAVAIIGRNGSGKSTLLQLITGISRPTHGSLLINGRITALLELGAGFHPEMSGRENVFMLGAVLGISRRWIDAQLDKIVDFAELSSYIDEPVKTYSSGMFVRLSFATATHFQPDLLIIDEALAVGDALFQKRCHARIRELVGNGASLLFVSHDHELVRTLTTKTLLLDQGKMVFWGDTKEGTRRYRAILFEHEAHYWSRVETPAEIPDVKPVAESLVYGIGGARLLSVRIHDATGHERSVFEPGESAHVTLIALCETDLEHLNVSIVIRRDRGEKIYSWGTLNQDMAILHGARLGDIFWERRFRAGETVSVTIEFLCRLGAGNYEVQGVVSRELTPRYGTQQILYWRDEATFFRVVGAPDWHFFGGLCDLEAVSRSND